MNSVIGKQLVQSCVAPLQDLGLSSGERGQKSTFPKETSGGLFGCSYSYFGASASSGADGFRIYHNQNCSVFPAKIFFLCFMGSLLYSCQTSNIILWVDMLPWQKLIPSSSTFPSGKMFEFYSLQTTSMFLTKLHGDLFLMLFT